MLRTFLLPGYEKYYKQIFDLAVANLRLPSSGNNTDNLESLNPVRQALADLFKEAFPLVRERYIKKKEEQKRAKQRKPLSLAFLIGLIQKMFWWFVRWVLFRPNADKLSVEQL